MSAPVLPEVTSRYGAPLGRPDTITEPAHPVKFHLQRLRWVDYGHDQGGAYWGHSPGEFIYWAQGDGADEVQEVFTRARTREQAKRAVLEVFPAARFYR